jgi:hypothetical protein
MNGLLQHGWTPCDDRTHEHGEAGLGTVLHPPSGNPRTYAPLLLTTYAEALRFGIATTNRHTV